MNPETAIDLTPLLGRTVTVEMTTKTGLQSVTGRLSFDYQCAYNVTTGDFPDVYWSIWFTARHIAKIDPDKKLITLKGAGQ